MPIIPLHDVDALSTTLLTFHRHSSLARPSSGAPNPVTTLLPYCTTSQAALPERSVWALTDLVKSIPDLAQAATTQEGQAVIRDVMSDNNHDAERVIEFWQHEVLL